MRTAIPVALVMTMLLFLDASAAAPTPVGKPLPAFPGAEGFGATTPGGPGGRIIEVTNLNARGPGSFLRPVRKKGPRIIVFRVSGVIPAGPWIREPFCTIAGQSAPLAECHGVINGRTALCGNVDSIKTLYRGRTPRSWKPSRAAAATS